VTGTHLLPDPDPTPHTPPPDDTGTCPASGDGTAGTGTTVEARAWLRMSAALSGHVPTVAEREDVTVLVAPGAGRGAPGCFVPALATIELDSATFTDAGLDPATARPDRPSDRDRYPAAWGVFTHECAHARHTHWHPTEDAGSAAMAAATLLEESRIEAAHLARRPTDRRWLRAAATTLILPEFTTPTPDPDPDSGAPATEATAEPGPPTAGGDGPAEAPAPATVEAPDPAPDATRDAGAVTATAAPVAHGEPAGTEKAGAGEAGVWVAAQAAGLLLARVDAGVLDEDETTAVAEAVTPVLGTERLERLRQLWRAAHATGDEDAEAMLALGRAWCEAVGLDPDTSVPDPTHTPTAVAVVGAVASAVGRVLAVAAEHDAPPPARPTVDRAAAREAERKSRDAAERAALRVFGPGAGGGRHGHARLGDTDLGEQRPPTEAERVAARRLARALKRAAARDRTATTVSSATPPGRLRMRAALAADAQRAAGAVPTAEPFTRTVSRHVPSPPLRVGIACDVSGSMHSVAAAVASAAWILARATSHVPDAKAATVIYGNHVRPVTHPGKAPALVQDFPACDGTERFTQAIDALDAALDLSRPGAARLLVIVSDGYYTPGELDTGQQRITRLRAAGCGILWLAPYEASTVMTGARRLVLADPAAAPDAIAEAATRALRDT
jgi:hypothetical protein